jgi:hypothetical protein
LTQVCACLLPARLSSRPALTPLRAQISRMNLDRELTLTVLYALASLAFLSYTAEASEIAFNVRVTNASPASMALDKPATCYPGSMSCPPMSNIPANSHLDYPVKADPALYAYWQFDVGAYSNGANYSCVFFINVVPDYNGACPKLEASGWPTNGKAGSPKCTAPVTRQQPAGPTCSNGSIEVSFAP